MENDGIRKPRVGSLFAGIGGFDLGFEQAGWETAWQVEKDPIARVVLADRFPHAERFEDVCDVGAATLSPVDCLVGGFPCQDISNSGSSKKGGRQGLRGVRSGLVYEVFRIIDEIQPPWLVLENVPALLHSNDCEDIQAIITELAKRGYLGCFRVLDSQYFGVAQKRRRLFLVAGLGRQPPLELLADAGTVESLPCSLFQESKPRRADAWAANTVQAANAPGRLTLGCETFVAEADGWGANVERLRKTEVDGLHTGLDAINHRQAFHAGNAVCPQVAEWIGRILINHLN